jgi:hypothetical protein
MNDEFNKEIAERWEKYHMGIDPALMGTHSNDSFESVIFPTVRRVFSKTLGSEIGGWATQEEKDKIIQRVKQENRSGKLDEVLNDIKYVEKKLEDDEEYKEATNRGVKPMGSPTGNLFFLDFKYGDHDVD